MSVYDVYHVEEKRSGTNLKHCQLYGNKDFCRSLRNTFETYYLNCFMGKDRVVYVDWNTNVEMPEDYSYRNTDYGFYRSVLNQIEEIEKKIA